MGDVTRSTATRIVGVLLACVSLLAAPANAWTPTWSDPSWPLAVLGRPCASVDLSGNRSLHLLCSTERNVTGLRMPVDLLHADLPGERVLFERAPSTARRASLRVAASGTRMIIEQVTCGACARVMGTAWLIDLATLTDADLATIQSSVGIPASPLLRDPAHWSAPLARIAREARE